MKSFNLIHVHDVHSSCGGEDFFSMWIELNTEEDHVEVQATLAAALLRIGNLTDHKNCIRFDHPEKAIVLILSELMSRFGEENICLLQQPGVYWTSDEPSGIQKPLPQRWIEVNCWSNNVTYDEEPRIILSWSDYIAKFKK